MTKNLETLLELIDQAGGVSLAIEALDDGGRVTHRGHWYPLAHLRLSSTAFVFYAVPNPGTFDTERVHVFMIRRVRRDRGSAAWVVMLQNAEFRYVLMPFESAEERERLAAWRRSPDQLVVDEVNDQFASATSYAEAQRRPRRARSATRRTSPAPAYRKGDDDA
jgi:hypothetical protein